MVRKIPKITKSGRNREKRVEMDIIERQMKDERVWCRWHTIFHRTADRNESGSVRIQDPQI
jgi:hypothetical protein